VPESRGPVEDPEPGQRGLIVQDETARRALELTRVEVRKAVDWTVPWLDLDVAAFRAYREGRSHTHPALDDGDPAERIMLTGVTGQDVLCLAGGGGQQSAVFSLLGARVTVLDLTPEQLEGDRVAARHYGYEVTTIQGDMRDLSALPDASYRRVYQPISTFHVPDLREVYAGVARVLKPGGLYFADYCVPLLYMAEDRGWDGSGYALRVGEPYVRGAILETEAGRMNYAEGESFGEFHHLLSDIVNGLVAEGLEIRGVWETPRPGLGAPLADLEPGSQEHRERYLPLGLSVIAAKGSG
jgi:SAM-dependent methyltransferase